jgi:hypothetical protein
VHLVPDFFTADDWKVVADVLGPNPQHLVELHTIQQSQSFIEYFTSLSPVELNMMSVCICIGSVVLILLQN